MNDQTHRTALPKAGGYGQGAVGRSEPRWSREEEGSTDVRSRPQLGVEESDVGHDPPTLPQPRQRTGGWEAASAGATTRTGVGSLTQQFIDAEDSEALAARVAHAEVREELSEVAAGDDLAMLWRAFDRSLGKPLDRPERLRIDHALGLSSVEITTLRKILGWLRQIDAVAGPTGLAPSAHGATSMLIPVEHGRIVLTPPLLAHLRSTARAAESEAQSLARWLCVMARHHRALPWELVTHDVEPFPAAAPRLTPLELLLACRPAGPSAPVDLACAFAAQTDALADETWIFGRDADGGLDGLILARSPERHALRDVYEAAAQCSEALSSAATLRLLSPRQTAWFGILQDALWFSVCGPRAISLQRAPLRSMGLVLSRINALEQSP
jgi:hypothetical protein